MKRWLKRIFSILIGAGLLAALAYSFRPQPVGVDVQTVERGLLQVTVDEDGKTRIQEPYTVSAPLAGNLLRIELDPGDQVYAGKTLLAVIEPSDPALLDAREIAQSEARVRAAEAKLRQAEPEREQARAALDYAESELGRAGQLFERKALSKDEYEEKSMLARMRTEEYRSARLSEEISRYELEVAKAALLRTKPGEMSAAELRFELRSPISGSVFRVLKKSACVVSAGAALLEVGDTTDLEMEIDVLSSDGVKIHPGDKVIIEQWGGEQPLTGRVRLVEPSAFTKISALGVEEQRVNVIADFIDPPDRRPTLGDAFRIEARIVIWEESNVLKVPTSALFRNGQGWMVFAVKEGRAQLREVEVGHRNGLEAEILKGLDEGEQVIVHPGDKVKDGVRIFER